MKLTMTSYASLMAVSASTPMSGTAVVTGVSEEIWGMSCKKEKGEVGLVRCLRQKLFETADVHRRQHHQRIMEMLGLGWGKYWGEGEGVAPPPGKGVLAEHIILREGRK